MYQLVFRLFFFVSVLSTLSFSADSSAEICPWWSGESVATTLPSPPFSEISGMIASRDYPGRIYLVNDSGDDGHFYSYDLNTGESQKIAIEGFPGYDIEAITLGPCGNDTCIFVGDIGDNQLRRKIVRIAAIKERQSFKSSVSPLLHKIMQYPDKAHDAEAMVMTSTGELLVFSKEFGYFSSEPTFIFKTNFSELASGGYGTFKALGRIQLKGLFGPPLLTITDASLSPDESNLLFLTYTNGYVVDTNDLLDQAASPTSTTYLDHRSFGLHWGRQSEAATYLYPDESILWTYEDSRSDVPLVLRECIR